MKNVDFKGLFAALGDALTRNWGLKLIALVLAIVIYYVIASSDADRGNARNDTQHFINR